MRNLELPGRSTVRGTRAMASTSHPAASLAAVEVLRRGGNAIDAAIAAIAVLGVVEPYNLGPGGDSFVLYRRASDGATIAYNGSGRAPAAASAAWYRDRGFAQIPEDGPHGVVVPGAVDAWLRLSADHGTMGLDALLAPAIGLAQDGHVVHEVVAYWWASGTARLATDAGGSATFLADGRPPRPGDVHRQPRLAETLRGIAARGRDGFYTGAVAEDMVATLRAKGGLHTLDDFAAARGEYVEPIATDYRDHRVFECPPNGQGVAALIMLNILGGLPVGDDPLAVERLHHEIEAGRLAREARDRLIGDPEQVDVPVGRMLSEAFATELRSTIDRHRAMAALPASPYAFGSDTSHVAIVDPDGNAVSWISSVFQAFGSGIVCPASGVTLNNRGHSFSLDEGHPNAIAGGKRPMHTIIPGLAEAPGRALLAFGVVGGHYQPWGHAHVLGNLLDFGMDEQAALDLPRLFHNGEFVELECGIPAETAAALADLGHDVRMHVPDDPAAFGPLGGAQLVRLDLGSGLLAGAADPRMDGMALGW